MWIKILILLILLVVIISLFGALRSLVRNQKDDKQKMVKLLAVRVGFSVLLLLFLGISLFMGWIEPHGVGN